MIRSRWPSKAPRLRCRRPGWSRCWVPQALVNQTLDVPALTESHDEVLAWTRTWTTVVVRTGGGRLVAAGRGRLENQADRAADWQLGRLMVAPDLAGRGIGSDGPHWTFSELPIRQ